MLALEVLPVLIVAVTLAVLSMVRLAGFLDAHGISHWYLVASLSSVFFIWCIATVLSSIANAARERRQRHEQMLTEQRYPFCHVTRLSNGSWFLTDKATGREYVPPRSNSR
jgi:hypothetical protein